MVSWSSVDTRALMDQNCINAIPFHDARALENPSGAGSLQNRAPLGKPRAADGRAGWLTGSDAGL